MKLIDDRMLIDGFCVTASPAVAQNNERSKHQFGWSRLHLGKKAVGGSPQHLPTFLSMPRLFPSAKGVSISASKAYFSPAIPSHINMWTKIELKSTALNYEHL
jgi:hypothetical protein